MIAIPIFHVYVPFLVHMFQHICFWKNIPITQHFRTFISSLQGQKLCVEPPSGDWSVSHFPQHSPAESICASLWDSSSGFWVFSGDRSCFPKAMIEEHYSAHRSLLLHVTIACYPQIGTSLTQCHSRLPIMEFLFYSFTLVGPRLRLQIGAL